MLTNVLASTIAMSMQNVKIQLATLDVPVTTDMRVMATSAMMLMNASQLTLARPMLTVSTVLAHTLAFVQAVLLMLMVHVLISTNVKLASRHVTKTRLALTSPVGTSAHAMLDILDLVSFVMM
jgi:hypothetical protein